VLFLIAGLPSPGLAAFGLVACRVTFVIVLRDYFLSPDAFITRAIGFPCEL